MSDAPSRDITNILFDLNLDNKLKSTNSTIAEPASPIIHDCENLSMMQTDFITKKVNRQTLDTVTLNLHNYIDERLNHEWAKKALA